MKKPIVFFSHSARDAASLTYLKQRFIELTGSAIEVFLSSDGQSVPLGKNWVASVEDALNETHLMFTFVTPSSLGSSWLYFESGVAYARKIQVVPVGLLGVNVEKLPPPLSFLQGFNVTDHRSLNNVIDIVNRTFSQTHTRGFRPADYSALVASSPEAGRHFGEHGRAVANIGISAIYTPASDNRAQLESALRDQDPPPFCHHGRYILPGASFAIHAEQLEAEIDAVFAPGALSRAEAVVSACSPRCREPVLQLLLADGVVGQVSAHQIVARLQGSSIVPVPEGHPELRTDTLTLRLGEVVFSVVGVAPLNRFALRVHAGPGFDRYDWAGLLSELFRAKLLSYAASL